MLWLSRKLLNLNTSDKLKKEVGKKKQRLHTATSENTTFGADAMSQAKVLNERELRKVLNHCNTYSHASRNRAMLLCTHLAGMRVGETAALRIRDVLGADGLVMDEIAL